MMESELQSIVVRAPRAGLPRGVLDDLREGLERCPDVAFAHLTEVDVVELPEPPGLVLFVWLVPQALRSLRSALNLVSEVVARSLPGDQYLDVVILNSAADLLEQVEAAGCLLVERDAEERRRALAAARRGAAAEESGGGPWWWPFR